MDVTARRLTEARVCFCCYPSASSAVRSLRNCSARGLVVVFFSFSTVAPLSGGTPSQVSPYGDSRCVAPRESSASPNHLSGCYAAANDDGTDDAHQVGGSPPVTSRLQIRPGTRDERRASSLGDDCRAIAPPRRHTVPLSCDTRDEPSSRLLSCFVASFGCRLDVA